MKDKAIAGIVMVGAFIVCLGGLSLMPVMQDSETKADLTASEHVERARRLLEKYNPMLARNSLLLAELREEDGVDVDMQNLDEMLEGAEEVYQEKLDQVWQDYNAKGSRPGIAAGVGARDKLISENSKYLSLAMQEVNSALSASSSHAAATRLKGLIHYHQGLEKSLEGLMMRRQADAVRRDLISEAMRVRESLLLTGEGVQGSIDAEISKVDARADELEAKIAQDREQLAQLDAKIEGLEAQIADANSRAAVARSEMDNLREKGIDFSDSQGGDQFAADYGAAEKKYREALREAHSLERGCYPHAKIDATGDYASGDYVENGSTEGLTVSHGLVHYQNERSALAVKISGDEQELRGLRADSSRFAGIKGQYAATQQIAEQVVKEAREQASDAAEILAEIEGEAYEIEEAALSDFQKSASLANTAAQRARQWVSEGRDKASELSPEAREFSAYEFQSKQGWLEGYAGVQAADAHLAAGWIHQRRYSAAVRNAGAFEAIGDLLALGEAVDIAAENEDAAAAKAEGTELVKLAVEELRKAHGKADRHWTFTAQSAGTTYLLVLFGDESYMRDVKNAYSKALEGREDAEFAGRIAARLEQLGG